MLSKPLRKKILFNMKKIRFVESMIAEKYKEQKMRCPVHLSIGQESVPSVLQLVLEKKDLAVSTHRGHAHYIGKGGNVNQMISEIYGKDTGCSRGKGGSMHLIDQSVGFMGTTAIVGGSIPVGVGLGLGIQLNNEKNVAIVFLGDGATEEGVFYESINFCAVRNLPVLFICENNFYSVYSSLSVRRPEKFKIHEMVASMGIKTHYQENGNDVELCYRNLNTIVQKMKHAPQPYFIQFDTFRYLEHCGPNWDDHLNYRKTGELAKWQDKDPLIKYEKFLRSNNILSQKEIQSMDEDISKMVEEAFDFAENSPWPQKEDAFKHIYKS